MFGRRKFIKISEVALALVLVLLKLIVASLD